MAIADSTGEPLFPVLDEWLRTLWRVLQGGPEAPASLEVIVGVIFGVVLIATVGYGLHRAVRRLRGSSTTTAGLSTSDSTPDRESIHPTSRGSPIDDPSSGRIDTTDTDLSLDDIEDEMLDLTLSILDQEGRENTRANIVEQAERLLALERAETSEFRLGLVRDAVEQSRADRAVIAPPSIDVEPTGLRRNGEYVRILTLASFPKTVIGGWLVPLVTTNLDVRVSYQLRPRDPSSIRGTLQQRLTQLQATLRRAEEKGRSNTHEARSDRNQLDRLLQRLTDGTTQLYDVAIYVEVAGPTPEAVDDTTRRVQLMLAERGVELVPIEYRQVDAQDTVAPVVADPIGNAELLEHDAAATLFNFVEPAVADEDGVLLGFDETGQPAIIDRFSFSGYSKVVTGKIGSGKTYAVTLALWRRLLIDSAFEALMFDPTGDDFAAFTRAMNGQVVRFGGDVTINPLEIHRGTGHVDDPYADKLRSLTGMFRTFFAQAGDALSAEAAGLLQQVFHLAFLSYGITPDPGTHDRPDPTMMDVLDILGHLADGEQPLEFLDYQEAAADIPRDERDTLDELLAEVAPRLRAGTGGETAAQAETLLRALEAFQPGGVASNLTGTTTIDLDARLVCFDMSAFADTNHAPLLQHVMLDWCYERAKRPESSERTLEVVFEEAHYFLDDPAARALVGLFTRHSRHFGAGLTLISQSPDDFLAESEDDIHSPQALYDQCDIKQLFYQTNVSDATVEYFDLTPGEVSFLQQAARGKTADYSQCLLDVTGLGRRQLDVRTGDYTYDVLTDSEAVAEWAAREEQAHEAAQQRATRGWKPTGFTTDGQPPTATGPPATAGSGRPSDAGPDAQPGTPDEHPGGQPGHESQSLSDRTGGTNASPPDSTGSMEDEQTQSIKSDHNDSSENPDEDTLEGDPDPTADPGARSSHGSEPDTKSEDD